MTDADSVVQSSLYRDLYPEYLYVIKNKGIVDEPESSTKLNVSGS